ncbi:MAG: hypothetical protein AAFR22_06730 [Chloroflexota bacterium]
MITKPDFNTYQTQIWLGVGLAAVTAATLTVLSPDKRVDVAALITMLIASIYVGFGIADGRPRHLMIEIVGLTFFSGLTLLGLWVSPFWLVAGLMLHGVYDLIHHPGAIPTEIAAWYPPFCAIYDWLVGGYLLLLLWV